MLLMELLLQESKRSLKNWSRACRLWSALTEVHQTSGQIRWLSNMKALPRANGVCDIFNSKLKKIAPDSLYMTKYGLTDNYSPKTESSIVFIHRFLEFTSFCPQLLGQVRVKRFRYCN